MKFLRLSTLLTGSHYPQEISLIPISFRRWVRPQEDGMVEGVRPEGYVNDKFQSHHLQSKPRLVLQCLKLMNNYRHNVSLKDQCFLFVPTVAPSTKSCVLPFSCTYLICVVMKTNSDQFLKDHNPADNCKTVWLCSP